MKIGKKFTLLACFAILLLAESALAVQAAAECKIIEQPENVYVNCENGKLTIVDQDNTIGIVKKTEIIDTPFLVDSEEFRDLQSQINVGILNNTIKLQEYGTYKLRINSKFNITVSYGKEYLARQSEAQLWTLFAYFVSSIVGVAGLISIIKKRYLLGLEKEEHNINQRSLKI